VDLDPRAGRTRRRVFDAVLALAGEGAGQGAEPGTGQRKAGLTISAVSRLAGVNRSSFYAHFDSLEDVACQLLDDSLAQITEIGWHERARAGADAAGHRDLLALVGHVAAQRGLYLAVLGAEESAAHAQAHLARVLRDRFASAFVHYGARSVTDDGAVTAAAVSVGASTAALLAGWLRGEFECSQRELADRILDAFPEWTRHLPQGVNHE
jgi:AcrR family transcriptional regulator